MLEFDYTFIWTGINLIVLFVIMRKLLFKPVTELIEKRTNAIRNDIEAANRDKIEAGKMKAEYDNMLKNARKEVEEILAAAKNKADAEYTRILEDAHKEARNLLERAAQEIESEREKLREEIKVYVSDLVIETAAKVIQKNIDSEANRQFVDEFINKVGAA